MRACWLVQTSWVTVHACVLIGADILGDCTRVRADWCRHPGWRQRAPDAHARRAALAARLQGQGVPADRAPAALRGPDAARDVPRPLPQHQQATLLPLQEAEREAAPRALLGRGAPRRLLAHREDTRLVTAHGVRGARGGVIWGGGVALRLRAVTRGLNRLTASKANGSDVVYVFTRVGSA